MTPYSDKAQTASAQATRFLIVDDHPLVRDSMHTLLEKLLDQSVTTTLAIDQDQMLKALRSAQTFDFAIIDLTLPDARGLEVLRSARETRPELRIIVFSARTEQDIVLRCLNFGVAGYIPKTMHNDLTAQALKLIFSGQPYVPSQAIKHTAGQGYRVNSPAVTSAGVSASDLSLTERQIDVLHLILRGLPNKVICRKLDLAEGTVKVHVSAVLRALGVRNRTQAIVAAREMGLEAGDL